jgi:FkbM family methyltransferase
VSFEPLPDAAEVLRRSTEGDPLWQVREMALGPSRGRLTLNVTALEGAMSSALEPDRSQTSALADASRVTDRIDVAMETVDQHLPGDESTVLLKLDCQGYDLEVIRGAGPRLDEVSILVTELSFTGLYAGQPTAAEVLTFLREREFVLAGLYRTNEVAFPLHMLEGDATFVHRRWAP